MKTISVYILIAAFLFPALGHAAAAPKVADIPQGTTQSLDIQPLILQNIDINKGLQDIFTRLNDLAGRTQIAVDQLGANGIDTTDAQAALTVAKNSLLKVKTTLDTPKYSQKTAESQLKDSRTGILQTLSLLKASLSSLDQTSQ